MGIDEIVISWVATGIFGLLGAFGIVVIGFLTLRKEKKKEKPEILSTIVVSISLFIGYLAFFTPVYIESSRDVIAEYDKTYQQQDRLAKIISVLETAALIESSDMTINKSEKIDFIRSAYSRIYSVNLPLVVDLAYVCLARIENYVMFIDEDVNGKRIEPPDGNFCMEAKSFAQKMRVEIDREYWQGWTARVLAPLVAD